MLMLCDGAHKCSSLLLHHHHHHHHHLRPTSAYSLLTGGRRILFFKLTEDCCFCFRLFMCVVSVAVAAAHRELQTEQYSKSTRHSERPAASPNTSFPVHSKIPVAELACQPDPILRLYVHECYLCCLTWIRLSSK